MDLHKTKPDSHPLQSRSRLRVPSQYQKQRIGRREPIPVTPYDLFGEIPVTWPEVDAWCIAVAGLTPESWRRKYYVEYWNVIEKIQQAKKCGLFDTIIEN